jgi:lactoylglutathione lyase
VNLARLLMLTAGLSILTGRVSLAAEPPPRLSYVALNVLDEKRALDFYIGVMGMTERRRITPSPAFKEIVLGFTANPQDAGVLLVVRAGHDKPYEVGDGFSRFILDVANLDAMVKRVTTAGVVMVRPITDVKDLKLRYAMLKDPDGYTIELVEHY